MKNLKFFGFASGLLGMGLLASCTAESGYINAPGENDQPIVKVVKTPEVYAYSGGQIIGVSSRGNAGDGDINNEIWKKFNTDGLENITDDERNAVLAAIKQKVTGSKISEEVVFPWENYFTQDVICFEDGNYTGAGNYGMKDVSVNNLEAFALGSDCSPYYHHGDNFNNYFEITNSKKMNQYFQKVLENGSQERISQTTLMTDMTLGSYEEMKGHQFRVWVNCHIQDHYYDYITVQVNGEWYICFDFGCGDEEHDKDGNPGRGATYNDWDYNDWIIKITPAYPRGVTIPDVWTEPKTDPEQPNPTPSTPETPEVSGTVIPGHVEVNLSIEERPDIEYLVSHLSIHVRDTTDVEVFINLPALYYCQTDDMEIVLKHDVEFRHEGPKYQTYTIDGQVVSLTVAFEEDGIRVTTDGINAKVLEYLRDKYGDGITFEVWNYMNLREKDWTSGNDILAFGQQNEITASQLREYLNKSTVEFLDEPYTSLYVNAFMYTPGCEEEGEEHTCGRFIDDCTVSIIDSQKGLFESDPETTWFYNGSNYNDLFWNKSYDKNQK